jgi:GNAT superfamily N-acetyltransferase
MITLNRTNSDNPDFRHLVAELDADLKIRDGEDHPFYSQFNKIDRIKYVVVAYDKNEIPIGCGAIKAYSTGMMEIKRMYVLPDRRGNGIASSILKALENWVIELGFEACLLETGIKQPEAIRLYQKNGYQVIQNYGPYENVMSSICFMKKLTYCD